MLQDWAFWAGGVTVFGAGLGLAVSVIVREASYAIDVYAAEIDAMRERFRGRR